MKENVIVCFFLNTVYSIEWCTCEIID